MTTWSRGEYIGSTLAEEIEAILEAENYHAEARSMVQYQPNCFSFGSGMAQGVQQMIESYIQSGMWLARHNMVHLQRAKEVKINAIGNVEIVF